MEHVTARQKDKNFVKLNNASFKWHVHNLYL
jgi:hypothetical protein